MTKRSVDRSDVLALLLTSSLVVATAACSGSSATVDDAALPDGAADAAPDAAQDANVDRGPDMHPDASEDRFAAQVEQKLQQLLDDFHQNKAPPGVVLGVEQGKRQWFGAVGKSYIAADTPMSTDQLFRIASITKIFVAALILLLEEDKQLSVEDPLSAYVPSFPGGDEIPLYRLLNHTSGIAFYQISSENRLKPYTPEELVQLAIDAGPSFAPGEPGKWEYSGTNYILLGQVIEAATGKKFHEVLRARILQPHGLSRTFVEGYDPDSGPEVHGYQRQNIWYHDMTNSFAQVHWTQGGMVSTAADLTRFMTLLQKGSIISPASLKKMREQYNVEVPKDVWPADVPASLTSYSYGLGLETYVLGDTYHGHAGRMPGCRSFLAFRPRDVTAVAVLVNEGQTNPVGLVLPVFLAL